MKVISKITVGNLISKGHEYNVEGENETNYIVNGIGWGKECFDVVSEVEIGFGISFIPQIPLNREQIIDLICDAIYECDNTQTPFNVLNRAESILNRWMDKINQII
jgi:hypothetical protein